MVTKMKLIKNKHVKYKKPQHEFSSRNTQIKKKCRVCSREYDLDLSEWSNIPLWKFENCSRECSKTYSSEKLVTLNT